MNVYMKAILRKIYYEIFLCFFLECYIYKIKYHSKKLMGGEALYIDVSVDWHCAEDRFATDRIPLKWTRIMIFQFQINKGILI